MVAVQTLWMLFPDLSGGDETESTAERSDHVQLELYSGMGAEIPTDKPTTHTTVP